MIGISEIGVWLDRRPAHGCQTAQPLKGSHLVHLLLTGVSRTYLMLPSKSKVQNTRVLRKTLFFEKQQPWQGEGPLMMQ